MTNMQISTLFCKREGPVFCENRWPQDFSKNASQHIHQHLFPMYCKYNIHDFWNISKFCGYNQSKEVVTTSEENMLLYDSCFVLF
jgi:hypothetical protein